MASPYKKALLDQFGVDERAGDSMPEQDQQTQPVGGPIEVGGVTGKTGGLDLGGMSGTGGIAGEKLPTPDTTAAPTKPVRPWDAPDWKGNVDNPRGMILGFDTDKLNTPGAGSAAKYSPAARLFSQGIAKNVGVSRGNLGNMVLYAQDNGFPNARAISDDKIDFGDGNGPIDVVRSDGQLVFQNTTDNPQWEAGYRAKYGTNPNPSQNASDLLGGGVGGGSHLGGPALDEALTGDPIAKIQQLISQMSGSRPNFAALMQQLGGG